MAQTKVEIKLKQFSQFCQELSLDSRIASQGQLFVDLTGNLDYIDMALSKGAKVVTKRKDVKNSRVFALEDFEETIFPFIQNFYQNPSETLHLIGVTGTCGKTTTTYLIHHLLTVLGLGSGLIGTVETKFKNEAFGSKLTTPDILCSTKYLKQMVEEKLGACAMEVSSHGLDQNRVKGLHFSSAVFTNLSHEHLDYHKTFKEYKKAKRSLFVSLNEEDKAFFNFDDPHSDFMKEYCSAKAFSFGFKEGADYRASSFELTKESTKFTLSYQHQKLLCKTPMIGKFNIYNALAAIAVCHQMGYSFEAIMQALASFGSVPGRLETIVLEDQKTVYIDFAHKPEALESVLMTLKKIPSSELLTVIGCGGDRDKDKRPVMAAIAEKYSDQVILTSDNPRTEEPTVIIEQMLKGIKKPDFVTIEVCRKTAIHKAIVKAKPGSIILIAGKGHENYQIVGDKKKTFDDRDVVKEFGLVRTS